MKHRNLFRYFLSSCLSLLLAVVVINGQEANSTNSAGETTNNSAAQQKNETPNLGNSFKYYFEVGGQFTKVTGDRPSKIEEYGQIRKGLLFRRMRIASNPADSPDYFRLIGRNIGEDDQQYLLDVGRYGVYRTQASFSGNTKLFSRDAKSLYTVDNRALTINDNIQTTLQNTAVASAPAVVQGFLSNASTIDLKTKRYTLDFKQTLYLTKEWTVRFNWNRQERLGNRPVGSGSYERVGTSTGDTFIVHSNELPVPVQSLTDHVTVGTSYLTKKWGVSFDYTYSNFKNSIPYITHDNPFRITDLQATGSGGVFDRMKMATGILSMEPSNHSQSLAISAFVDLPANTRLAGAWSWSFWKQNEQFVPYTLNTAIVTGVPTGLNITSASSLPEESLNGEVDVFTQDYVLASKPWKGFTFNLHYRDYDNQNKTHHILFPGYVAYLDSYWRTNIATVPIENEVQSFQRKNTTAEAIWDINKKLRWKAGYEWDGWVREHRQTANNNQHAVFTQFTYDPMGKFTTKLNYRYSTRKPDFYDAGLKEFNQLRMFDQARNIRHDADLQWQWSLNPQLGISGTLGFYSDDYDQHYFGLVRYVQKYGTLDLMYIPKDNTTFYLNYSYEDSKNSLQTVAKTAAPYALQNSWNRDETDIFNSFGAGITTYAMKDKLMLDLHYVFSDAKTKLYTYNVSTPLANSVLNATTFPFPEVKNRLQEFNSDISYQFTDKWGLGIRYIYQPYDLDDFAWNSLSPYPINQFPVEQTATRFLLLDSRYTSHNAHIIGVYIRFGK